MVIVFYQRPKNYIPCSMTIVRSLSFSRPLFSRLHTRILEWYRYLWCACVCIVYVCDCNKSVCDVVAVRYIRARTFNCVHYGANIFHSPAQHLHILFAIAHLYVFFCVIFHFFHVSLLGFVFRLSFLQFHHHISPFHNHKTFFLHSLLFIKKTIPIDCICRWYKMEREKPLARLKYRGIHGNPIQRKEVT